MSKKKKKAATTRAGKYVKEEMDTIRSGEHGAKNARQAIAIGLSKARRAGVPVGKNPNAPARSAKGKAKKKKTTARGKKKTTSRTSAKRSKAAVRALKKQPRRAASHLALSRQAKAAARKRK